MKNNNTEQIINSVKKSAQECFKAYLDELKDKSINLSAYSKTFKGDVYDGNFKGTVSNRNYDFDPFILLTKMKEDSDEFNSEKKQNLKAHLIFLKEINNQDKHTHAGPFVFIGAGAVVGTALILLGPSLPISAIASLLMVSIGGVLEVGVIILTVKEAIKSGSICYDEDKAFIYDSYTNNYSYTLLSKQDDLSKATIKKDELLTFIKQNDCLPSSDKELADSVKISQEKHRISSQQGCTLHSSQTITKIGEISSKQNTEQPQTDSIIVNTLTTKL